MIESNFMVVFFPGQKEIFDVMAVELDRWAVKLEKEFIILIVKVDFTEDSAWAVVVVKAGEEMFVNFENFCPGKKWEVMYKRL